MFTGDLLEGVFMLVGKRFWGAAAAVALLCLGFAGSATAAPALTGRPIMNYQTFQCLAVDDAGYVSNVYLKPCDRTTALQQWTLQPIGGGLYHIATNGTTADGSYCLSMAPADPVVGWPTMTQPCYLNLTEEQWQLRTGQGGYTAFYSPQDGRYLDSVDTQGRGWAVMGPDTGTPTATETWTLL